jgi:serine/threonine protein kinase/tetratricopeptide (TPR) repeat protein
MDGISPIEAFLTGRLPEDELLKEVERVIAEGSEDDRTILVSDWRTKSGRIKTSETRRKLDARVQPIAWSLPGSTKTEESQASAKLQRPLRPGDVLANRFIIEAKIGSGGMSTVFKARDLRREEAQDRNPFVAVKTLNVDILQREDSLKILQREARKAQNLSHPNIVRVYDFDRDDDTLFITMELLEGSSLEQIINKNGLLGTQLPILLPIVEQIVSALQFAHEEGIVHSDLKPANIIVLPNGRVKVIDFGIARAIPNPNQNTSDRTTFDVHALGAMTPAYASPEMLEGQAPDPRDDVFALACIVYEFLTGRHPFGRVPASMARVGNFKPQEPANLSPHRWKALQAGLHLDRSKRIASPQLLFLEFAADAPAAAQRYRKVLKTVIPGLMIVGIGIGAGLYIVDTTNLIRPDTELNARKIAQQRAADQAAQKLAQQKAAEEAAQRLAQQKAAEEAAQKLAQQKAAEEAAQRLAQQKAAEQAAQRLAQQKVAEEAAQKLAQQKAADEAAQKLAQQKAADEAAQKLAQQKATEEAAQKLAQQKAAEEAAQKLAQQKAADEAAQKLAQQKAAEEAAQRLAQQNAADEAAQRLAQQKAAEEAAQKLAQQKASEEATQQRTVADLAQPKTDQIGPPQIAEAQRLLTTMGLSTGDADGKAGPRTHEMVRAFQLAVGQQSTGEVTPVLLDSLRHGMPPISARAKGLFTLAEEARRAVRPGDAIRLYQVGLKLAPNDTSAWLALGDLDRERNDYDAARRAYETVQQSGGPTANIAHDRLAGLPIQQPIQQELPAAQAINDQNGSYTGWRTTTRGEAPDCIADREMASVVVSDSRFSLNYYALTTIQVAVADDGSFSSGALYRVGRVWALDGKIADNVLNADLIAGTCTYHFSLNKPREGRSKRTP